eukprot:1035536-Pleurochrysis_carterae.AAC.1
MKGEGQYELQMAEVAHSSTKKKPDCADDESSGECADRVHPRNLRTKSQSTEAQLEPVLEQECTERTGEPRIQTSTRDGSVDGGWWHQRLIEHSNGKALCKGAPRQEFPNRGVESIRRVATEANVRNAFHSTKLERCRPIVHRSAHRALEVWLHRSPIQLRAHLIRCPSKSSLVD